MPLSQAYDTTVCPNCPDRWHPVIHRGHVQQKEPIMVQIEDGRIIDEDGFSTSFPMDFSIADRFGAAAVKDTFNRAFAEWKGQYKYLTHLVIALNEKIWKWHEKGNKQLAELYNSLWEKADSYATENLKGEEAKYFYRATD